VALRRPDGTTAAVFSALGAPPQAIEEAAREDHGPTRPRVSRLEDPQTDREYLDRVAPWNANWAWYRKLVGN
jgi:hypothetical protein